MISLLFYFFLFSSFCYIPSRLYTCSFLCLKCTPNFLFKKLSIPAFVLRLFTSLLIIFSKSSSPIYCTSPSQVFAQNLSAYLSDAFGSDLFPKPSLFHLHILFYRYHGKTVTLNDLKFSFSLKIAYNPVFKR